MKLTPRISVVTKNAVAHATPVNTLQAPLSGFAQTAAQEHSDCWSGLIDIDDSATIIDDLLNELLANSGESIIALRQSARYCPRLQPVEYAARSIPLTDSAAYLITGGLGALGLNAVQCLAAKGAKHLFLTGRRGVASDSAAKTINELIAQGVTVTIVKADISQAQAVSDLLKQIAATGKQLKGIIHAAGIMENTLLVQQTPDTFKRINAAKIIGTWHLHELTQTSELDFFVCFSSISSLLGLSGLASYAAANAFMDGLMHYRRSLGLSGLSINWGAWGGAGMVETLSPSQQQELEAIGMNSLTSAQGKQLLSTLLLQATEAQIIAASVNWQRLQQSAHLPIIKNLLNAEPTALTIMDSLHNTAEAQRYTALKNYIRLQVAKQLGFSETQLDDTSGFSELGMDSLTTVKLKNQFQQDFAQPLPATLLINYHTIQLLSDYLYTRLFAEPEQPQTTPDMPDSSAVEHLSEQELAAMIAAKLAAFEN